MSYDPKTTVADTMGAVFRACSSQGQPLQCTERLFLAGSRAARARAPLSYRVNRCNSPSAHVGHQSFPDVKYRERARGLVLTASSLTVANP